MYRPEPQPQPGRHRSSSGHEFHDNQILGGTNVLGNIYQDTYHYHISPENPLSLLLFATNAPFNSYARQHKPTCLSKTCVDLVQEIY
ncbi:hypothetical protein F5882DRAFT_401521, partial [Hyaloscypha sp. PMI_1271]